MLELPNDFHPTDMHWFPRGHHGGGSVKAANSHQKRGGSSSQSTNFDYHITKMFCNLKIKANIGCKFH